MSSLTANSHLLRALEAALTLGPLRESDAVGAAAEGSGAALAVLVAPVALGAGRRRLAVAAAPEPETTGISIINYSMSTLYYMVN